MSQRILLICYVRNEAAKLSETLQKVDPNCVVETVFSLGQGLQSLETHPGQTVVLNFEQITDVVYRHVCSLRATVAQCPLLVMGAVTDVNLMKKLTELGRSVVLDKPYTEKDLAGIAHKLLTADPVLQRVHRRFDTNQKATVEIYGKNIESESKVLNLSRGGAYLRWHSNAPIKVGDLVRMRVELEKIRNEHRLHAKVVWVENAASSKDGVGVGVEFLDPTQVYREMAGR